MAVSHKYPTAAVTFYVQDRGFGGVSSVMRGAGSGMQINLDKFQQYQDETFNSNK